MYLENLTYLAILIAALKIDAASDVGQAPAGHWEAGQHAGARTAHQLAQAAHQAPQCHQHLIRRQNVSWKSTCLNKSLKKFLFTFDLKKRTNDYEGSRAIHPPGPWPPPASSSSPGLTTTEAGPETREWPRNIPQPGSPLRLPASPLARNHCSHWFTLGASLLVGPPGGSLRFQGLSSKFCIRLIGFVQLVKDSRVRAPTLHAYCNCTTNQLIHFDNSVPPCLHTPSVMRRLHLRPKL